MASANAALRQYGQRVGASPQAVALLVADGWTDREIAQQYGCTRQTIWLLRREFNIATTRPVVCHRAIWPLPADVEAAWGELLGLRRYEDVPPSRVWSLTGPVQRPPV